ncbi:hypothetical protein VHEMI04557 [[Torrubiella] hemipterigena]|uniref:NAD(P)-binding domain-containing protein n=1 Tax=[Torrubiella] hemipterigena TaxID=1531966 RepID=A0A0A1T1P5_9HYPO|nr:hypothetical protein VHEMI04557 [[Torrubiella] hemipterigena]
MHLLLIGATGRNGLLVLKAALASSHTVTALVRESSKSKLPQHPNLTIICGQPTSAADIAKALVTPRPPEAVISTLNLRRVSESPFAAPSPDTPNDFLNTAMNALLDAIRSTTTLGSEPKIIINSMQGVAESKSSLIFPIRMLFHHSNMRYTLSGHQELDELVKGSGMAYVMARAARLTDGNGKADVSRVKDLGDDGKGAAWTASIARDDLAAWLVKAAESDKWNNHSPVLVN